LRRFELRDVEDVPLDLESEGLEEVRWYTEKRAEEELKVDYNVFRSVYWPHFPQNFTKGLGVHSNLFRDIVVSKFSSNRSSSCLE